MWISLNFSKYNFVILFIFYLAIKINLLDISNGIRSNEATTNIWTCDRCNNKKVMENFLPFWLFIFSRLYYCELHEGNFLHWNKYMMMNSDILNILSGFMVGFYSCITNNLFYFIEYVVPVFIYLFFDIWVARISCTSYNKGWFFKRLEK